MKWEILMLTATLAFELVCSQEPGDCSVSAVTQFSLSNLNLACQGALLQVRNNRNEMDQFTGLIDDNGMQTVNTACQDSCFGELYRFYLDNCPDDANATANANGINQICSLNDNDLRCAYAVVTPAVYVQLFSSNSLGIALATCTTANETNPCPDGCREALEQLLTDLGCCLATSYTTTPSGDPGIAALLPACGMSTIKACDELFTDTGISVSIGAVTVFLVAAVALAIY